MTAGRSLPVPAHRHERLELRSRPASGRCHECGSPRVAASCCNCHRLLCGDHGMRRDPRSVAAELRGSLPPSWTPRGPTLDHGPRLRFCSRCARRVGLRTGGLAAGSVALVVGLVVSLWNTPIGAALMLVGVCITAAVGYSYMQRLRNLHRWLSRWLRIDPGILSISVIDTVKGRAELADAKTTYAVRDITVTGELVVDAEWSDTAWTGVREHCRRNGVTDPAKVSFAAGALVLRGQVGLTLTTAAGCRLRQPSVLVLAGGVREHEFLKSADGAGNRGCKISAKYDITPEHGKAWTMPIWLTPTIVPRSDRRSLDLEFQWTKFGPVKDGLPLGSIECLSIEVPIGWGSVLDSTEDALVSVGETGSTRRIEFRNITTVPHTIRGRHRISLSVENEIKSTDTIRGEIVARFRGNLCRIKQVDLHDSGGNKRPERPKKNLSTKVCLKFDLSLAAVRYEAIRVMPPAPEHGEVPHLQEGGNADAQPIPKPHQRAFERVVPDAATVARVMTALSDGDYYVKRVVENPPLPGRTASAVNRYWDISGRKYEGVYPIDFHLVLSGHEMYEGASVTSGRTEMALSVRGAYTSPEIDQKVRDEWDGLRERVENVLMTCRLPDPRREAAGLTRRLIDTLRENGQITDRVASRLETAMGEEFGPTG